MGLLLVLPDRTPLFAAPLPLVVFWETGVQVPRCVEVTFTSDGAGGYRVTGFVEVQDSPSVLIRWQWSVSVRRVESGRWERRGWGSIGGRPIRMR